MSAPERMAHEQGPKYLEAIDISGWQGTIDWGRLVEGGLDFAYIKASQGITIVDGRFEEHWASARTAGLPVGAYHFLDNSDPAQQARHFLDTLERLAPDRVAMLAPMLDVERAQDPHQEMGAAVLTWLEIVEGEVGVRPLIYTGPAFASMHLAHCTELATETLWQAEYPPHPTASPRLRCPPWPADGWTIWQYTGTGLDRSWARRMPSSAPVTA